MSDKPKALDRARSADQDESDLAVVLAYVRELQQRGFYGLVTLTFTDGELRHTREERTRPTAALVASLWDRLPEKVRPALRERFEAHGAFGVDS